MWVAPSKDLSLTFSPSLHASRAHGNVVLTRIPFCGIKLKMCSARKPGRMCDTGSHAHASQLVSRLRRACSAKPCQWPTR